MKENNKNTFCANCGEKNNNSNKFCTSCGKSLEEKYDLNIKFDINLNVKNETTERILIMQ